MHSVIAMLPWLAVMLIGAKLAGTLSQRSGMPSVFGKLLLGLLLGPSLLNLLHPGETLQLLGQIGVIIMMFMAGVETDIEQMRRVGAAALLTAIGGVVLPLGSGYLIGAVFGMGPLESLFLGAVLTATSVSISAAVLRELGHLRSQIGSTIMGAAVIDDVLGVIVLSAVLALAGEGNFWLTMLKMAIYLPVAWFVGNWLVPRLLHAEQYTYQKETSIAVLIGVLLIYAWMAEALGSVASITGAYILGIIIARHTPADHHLHDGINIVGYGFFVPLFFVNIGLEARADALWQAPALASTVLALAVGGKIIGCGLGARLGRLDNQSSLAIGVGMIARGEVALVMVAAGRAAGLVDDLLFSATIFMTLITTLITPLLLRYTLRTTQANSAEADLVLAEEQGA